MARRVYLDYAATSPLRTESREAITQNLKASFGNPSSIHAYGREARVALEDARQTLMSLFAVDGHLVLTGSGSEADNLALLGFARRHPNGCVIHTSIEHKAVIEASQALKRSGYDIRLAPVDRRGIVNVAALADLVPVDGRPSLVSVMWANNETGVVQPLTEVADLCVKRGATLHSDAVQAFGKIPLELAKLPASLVSISAHKLGGPKGIGALLIRDEVALEPIVYGGGQETGLRSGTESVAAAVGFARAAAAAFAELAEESQRLAALRDRLESELVNAFPELVVNGAEAPTRVPHILNVSFPDVDIEVLLTSLDLEGICVSSGSACTTGSVEPSHVMRAMGREGDHAQNTIRFSLGWGTREDDIEYVLEVLPKVVRRVRQFDVRKGRTGP